MSLRMKKVAKSLRARFGVAEGVRPAKPGDTCEVEVTNLRDFAEVFANLEGKSVLCGKQAHVISAGQAQCKGHMKEAHKRRRR